MYHRYRIPYIFGENELAIFIAIVIAIFIAIVFFSIMAIIATIIVIIIIIIITFVISISLPNHHHYIISLIQYMYNTAE